MAKEKFYTSERNVQIVLSLLKANGIRKIIASPGATNFTFVGSVQNVHSLRSILLWTNVRQHIWLVAWRLKVEKLWL